MTPFCKLELTFFSEEDVIASFKTPIYQPHKLIVDSFFSFINHSIPQDFFRRCTHVSIRFNIDSFFPERIISTKYFSLFLFGFLEDNLHLCPTKLFLHPNFSIYEQTDTPSTPHQQLEYFIDLIQKNLADFSRSDSRIFFEFQISTIYLFQQRQTHATNHLSDPEIPF